MSGSRSAARAVAGDGRRVAPVTTGVAAFVAVGPAGGTSSTGDGGMGES